MTNQSSHPDPERRRPLGGCTTPAADLVEFVNPGRQARRPGRDARDPRVRRFHSRIGDHVDRCHSRSASTSMSPARHGLERPQAIAAAPCVGDHDRLAASLLADEVALQPRAEGDGTHDDRLVGWWPGADPPGRVAARTRGPARLAGPGRRTSGSAAALAVLAARRRQSSERRLTRARVRPVSRVRAPARPDKSLCRESDHGTTAVSLGLYGNEKNCSG